MKKFYYLMLVSILVTSISSIGCKKQEGKNYDSQLITEDVKAQIGNLGFSAENVKKVNGGYLVEGDILLTSENLKESPSTKTLSIAQTEQYRTINQVRNLPRVITISVTNLPDVYSNATDLMITRYNKLGLSLTFQRATSGTIGNINVVGFDQGPSNGSIVLGSSGFPTSSGEPYNEIKMNTNAAAYGSNPALLYLTSVLQHEVGHTIGMRHTDYSNRSYSCGGSAVNEGASDVGAIQIPGTPSDPDAGSFMLACTSGGDRTFNANDVVALNYLYKQSPTAPAPVAGAVALYQYYNSKVEDHFYSTDYNVPGGYVYERIIGYVFPAEAGGTVPLYKYFNKANSDHYYTTVQSNYGGYVYEGIACYVYPSQVTKSLPVYQHVSGAGHHFYNDRPGTIPYYTFEDIKFYIIQPQQVTERPLPEEDSRELYQYYNGNYADHYYTTYKTNYEGYEYEKILGYVSTTQKSNTVPLYIYINSYKSGSISRQDHYYTLVKQNYAGYVYEGIVGYVYPVAGTNTSAIYSYYNTSLIDHYYNTVNASFSGYINEGIKFYLLSYVN